MYFSFWCAVAIYLSQSVLSFSSGVLGVGPNFNSLLSPSLLLVQNPVSTLFQGFPTRVFDSVPFGLITHLKNMNLEGVIFLISNSTKKCALRASARMGTGIPGNSYGPNLSVPHLGPGLKGL